MDKRLVLVCDFIKILWRCGNRHGRLRQCDGKRLCTFFLVCEVRPPDDGRLFALILEIALSAGAACWLLNDNWCRPDTRAVEEKLYEMGRGHISYL